MVDAYTRECLAIDVERRLRSDDILPRLAALIVHHGAPEYLRSDNGPECAARAVRAWLARVGVQTWFLEPGSPWGNGYVESVNGKLRAALLNGEIFETRGEAKVLIERWRRTDNPIRPHSSWGDQPPAPETIAPAPQYPRWA